MTVLDLSYLAETSTHSAIRSNIDSTGEITEIYCSLNASSSTAARRKPVNQMKEAGGSTTSRLCGTQLSSSLGGPRPKESQCRLT